MSTSLSNFFINFSIYKVIYLLILLYAIYQIVTWTWRRVMILIDLKTFSMGAVFKLSYCLIILCLTLVSLSNVLTPSTSYRAHPYIILIMSTNLIYVATSLGTNYYRNHKKSRLIANSILFSLWCILGTFIFIISITSVKRIPLSFTNTLCSFGWEIYGKTYPFWHHGNVEVYVITTSILSNIFNFLCLLTLWIFTRVIPEMKLKLYSYKYLLCINILIFIRDLAYFSYCMVDSGIGYIAYNVTGIILAICILATAVLYSLFIRSESKYDRNLKKQRVKTLKRDLNTIINDFDQSKSLTEKVECVRRFKYLVLRGKIMESKIDLVKEVQHKSPGLYAHFTSLTNEEITIESVQKTRH